MLLAAIFFTSADFIENGSGGELWPPEPR